MAHDVFRHALRNEGIPALFLLYSCHSILSTVIGRDFWDHKETGFEEI
jgi:hypothetical protein